ncbi:MAG TPA: carbon starvation CstA family protein [Bryobacteraceae bacterium]|nr:carbon starvation CstA family protein [Bryobacteraceae bacterium]
MRNRLTALLWALISVVGAVCLAALASSRHEPVNSLWLVASAACIFLIGFRFYGKFIAAKVMALDDRRATPAERFRDGRDFEPTNKWILLGHHFAAIAGPGPLVGPTLAAQFGYLPGVLWILFGAVLAGAVQDFVILFCSMRRDGKTLGQMAHEEIGRVGGIVSLFTVLLIMVVLLAVVALVVVNALKGSPWGTFTIAATIPIAVFMGLYLRYIRPGKVLECSAIGFVLVLLGIAGGQWVAGSAQYAAWFTFGGIALAIAIMLYGFLASTLPVWLLLAPRDYLSTFVKLGVVISLAIGILFTHPQLQMPPLTRFVNGTGPIFAGKVFPFCFITIACGAISGFHALISSGTTPKMIAKEWHAWPVGYGGMLLEGFVGIMALVAAASLSPGVFFAVNAPAGVVGANAQAAAATISGWGFPVTAAEMIRLAHTVGETTLFSRTGGAPSLALGMAHIFGGVLARTGFGNGLLSFWYHFAIMFEALFILTIIDAGTRVGRFMVQDLAGHIYKPLGRTGWTPGVLGASAVIVVAWGYFLYQGVIDPLGGINSLWPLFGISNQLLAAIALCVATTVILKTRPARYACITAIPLIWLSVVTFTAGLEKILSPEPRLGFLAHAAALSDAIATGKVAAANLAQTRAVIFNERLDAAVCAAFLLLVLVILVEASRVWYGLLRGTRAAVTSESPFVPSQLDPESI